ncbi:MAG: YceI family protein [bacterium]|nr:YceI family protein [bacterium]
MKKIFYIISISALFAACNSQPAAEATTEQVVATDSLGTTYLVDTASSILNWTGEALSYGHNGTMKLSEGSLTVKDGNLTAGSFIIDIKSIKDLDLADPTKNAYLVGHLNDTDFFNTKLYPTGKFEVTSVAALSNDTAGNTHAISGNLTLKGITKNIVVPAKVTINGDAVEATGSVMVNRLDFGVKYNSTTAFPNLKAKLKDKAINDEFKVVIDLKAKKG